MRNKKLYAMVFVLLLLTLPMTVFAYSFVGRWETNSAKYYYTVDSQFSGAANAWNVTDFRLSYASTYYGINCIVVNNSNVEWDGQCNLGKDFLYIRSAIIMLNSGKGATWNNANALKSVAVHEFGHAMGLDENGSTKTVMNDHTWGTNSRYGTFGITSPQSDDIGGINSRY